MLPTVNFDARCLTRIVSIVPPFGYPLRPIEFCLWVLQTVCPLVYFCCGSVFCRPFNWPVFAHLSTPSPKPFAIHRTIALLSNATASTDLSCHTRWSTNSCVVISVGGYGSSRYCCLDLSSIFCAQLCALFVF